MARRLATGASSGRHERVRNPLSQRGLSLVTSTVVVVLCSLGATVGMGSIAGFQSMLSRLHHFDAPWIAVAAGGAALAFLGYRLAFDAVVWGGTEQVLSRRERLGIVAAGFGAFVPRGGTAIDRYIVRVTGTDRRQGDVRLATLQVLEFVPMTVGACVAAYVALVVGGPGRPPIDYDLPWAVGPPVGALLALLAVHRWRRRLRDAEGWRYWLGVALDGIWSIKALLGRGAGRRGLPLLGMTLFSVGENAAVWAAMAAFGFEMSLPGLILGYGVGYVISRRSAPLGGAGIIDVLLILALANAGAPLAAAAVGTFAYRFFNLWCPMPLSLASLATVRRFVDSLPRPTSASS